MFRHNLLLIYRNCNRFKTTFFINLIGLSTGISCTLLIYLWVKDELAMDGFHRSDSRLHQVMKNNTTDLGIETDEDTPGLLARTLAEELPEVESSVSVFPPATHTFNGILSFKDNKMKAASKFADKNFFNMFSYPLTHGNEQQVLADKYNVVISEKVAMDLFNTTANVVGKAIDWKSERLEGQFFISGIFKKPLANSTIQFDILFSYDLLLEKFPNFLRWSNSGPSTYLILKENTDVADFNDKIAGLVKSKHKESTLTLFTRPYSDRHLYNDYKDGVQAGGRIEYVRLFSVIAFLILLIACFNFMNLSTAKAFRRAREVGIKKAMGASRRTLTVQYLGESVLMSFFSLLAAILIVDLLLPQFNGITGKHLVLHFDTSLILTLIAIVLFTGLVAGSYPALYLSGFNPALTLKGVTTFLKNKNGSGELWARNGLVIFQFTISIVLIVSVLVVYNQMRFVQSKNLGFNRDNVISFPAEGKVAESTESFLSQTKMFPGVVNASYMDGDLTALHNGTTGVEWDGKNPDEVIDFEFLSVGHELIRTLDIELKEGRNFSVDNASEDSKVIFNESAIESMGLTDPVGKRIKLWGEEKEIIGVIKDFHFESLYENVKPFFFRLSPRGNRNILVKIKAGMEQETLARLENIYREYNPGVSFEYKFLDEEYQNLYASENRVAILSQYGAGIAILISCLGLFGLASFTAERRLKEIGIRKVLGSSVFDIVYLLSGDFTKIIFASIFIALPLSYFASNEWLGSFAYKIELEWWYFVGSGVTAFLIAWITISTQAFKAARVNPTHCLKEE
jgi:ABC-type antimicrobial peptide transport system permease subunit